MFRITIRYHLCSVFKVQFAFVNSDEICLFFANEKMNFAEFGGLKWTRTTDLTLIRRAL